MAKPLQSASIAAPGFYGLNTQESSITLAAGFALQADNCVIDKYGRLGARKGWQYVTSGNEGVNLKGAHEFIDINGSRYFGCWSDTSFYIADGSTLTQIGYSGVNTVTKGNWQAATLNDAAFLFSSDYSPIYFNPTNGVLNDIISIELSESVSITSSGTTATVTHTAHGFVTEQEVTISGCDQTEYNGTFTITVTGTNTYTYTMPNSTSSPATGDPQVSWPKSEPPHANTVLSAYGRLWAANTNENKNTVYWSDLLDGTDWSSGTAGSLDLSSVLVKGNDEIVALGAHAGRLIIFCKNNIVIYNSSDNASSFDPATMKLVEVINGVGCIARDSVQNTGTDILFLANDGVRSIGRLIQEKSQPFRDLSKNVRDDLVRDIHGTDVDAIRSVYSATEAFYLLLIPEYQRIYCFDTRQMLEDGAARVTIWDNQTHTNMLEKYDPILKKQEIYFTNVDGLAEYTGYTDNGNPYVMKYYTNYFDFGDATNIKMLKRLSTTLVGGSGQDMVLKVGYDYDDSYRSFPIAISSQVNAEYGKAEFGSFANLQSEIEISDFYINEVTGFYALYLPNSAFTLELNKTAVNVSTTPAEFKDWAKSIASDGFAYGDMNKDGLLKASDALEFTKLAAGYEGYTRDNDTFGRYRRWRDIVLPSLLSQPWDYSSLIDPVTIASDDKTLLDTATGKYWKVDTTPLEGNGHALQIPLYQDPLSIYNLATSDSGGFTGPTAYYFKVQDEWYEEGNPYEFTIAEDIAEYTIGTLSDTVRASVGGSGSVIQVGFESTINGSQLSIQKLDIYIKTGRTY